MTSAHVGSGIGGADGGGTGAGATGTGPPVGAPAATFGAGAKTGGGGETGGATGAGGDGEATSNPFQFRNRNSNSLRFARSPVSTMSLRHSSFETTFPFRIRSLPARRVIWRK